MCDSMWEDNTEDIFQSITIEQALSEPPWNTSLLSQMWSQVKLWEQSVFFRAPNKYRYQKKDKFGKIKFRGYDNYANKKTVVRNANTQTELTLGISGPFGSAISSSIPGLGDGNFFLLEEGQSETEET